MYTISDLFDLEHTEADVAQRLQECQPPVDAVPGAGVRSDIHRTAQPSGVHVPGLVFVGEGAVGAGAVIGCAVVSDPCDMQHRPIPGCGLLGFIMAKIFLMVLV